ncbi:MAG: NAD(P)H-dependent glycerol-3-phosphate dehydrogenase [Flavobacteriaceae bacterium]
MADFSKIAVLGSGSWATALVKILCENNAIVGWYMRNEAIYEHLLNEGHNPNYLSSVEFNTHQLDIYTNLDEVVSQYDVIIVAIPSFYLESALEALTESLENKIIFSAVKGIVPEQKMLVGTYLAAKFNVAEAHLGVITGPCHAEEVALERLSYLTVASVNMDLATEMKAKLECAYIRTTISDDVVGTEYAATLKNVYAIAVGMAHGLGYGDNFISVLISSAMREMKRFTKHVNNRKRNINKSAYLGDMLVTAYSVFSRNRMLGNMIGKGYTVKSALMEMTMIAEGYHGAKTTYELVSDSGKKFPILQCVYQVLYEKASAKKKIKALSQELN